MQSLFQYAIDKEKRIVNAIGHYSVLRNLTVEKINQFLEQVELVDCLEENNIEHVQQKILELSTMNKKLILSLLQKELVSQFSHAGYLGARIK